MPHHVKTISLRGIAQLNDERLVLRILVQYLAGTYRKREISFITENNQKLRKLNDVKVLLVKSTILYITALHSIKGYRI